jgi:dihydrofolate reductase
MGSLVWSINVTIDGCCDHTAVVPDAEFHAYTAEVLDNSDCLLLGRASFELLESYWPLVARGEIADADDVQIAFAKKLDAKPKFVATRTLEKAGWNATILRGAAEDSVRSLKQQQGRVLVFGSPGLGSSLSASRLIDEHHFLLQPIAAGRGPRLFEGADQRRFDLLEARRFGSGVVLLRQRALP